MEKIIYLIFGLTFFLISVHYFTKILEWNEKRKASKFKDPKSEFISDLYKFQRKWSEKGQFDFASGINTLILHFSIPKEKDAATDYGKNIQKKLKELEEEDEQS